MPSEANPLSTAIGYTALAELRPALVSYFRRRCGNAAEAEDLAQDVILRALTSRARWTSAEEAKGYIFRIAINRWRERGRRKLTSGTGVDWDEVAVQAFTEEISVERVLSSQEELRRIAGALLELGERTRDVLVLCRFEQMKMAEIAEALGISVSAVEKHLVKATAHLVRRMAQDDCEQ